MRRQVSAFTAGLAVSGFSILMLLIVVSIPAYPIASYFIYKPTSNATQARSWTVESEQTLKYVGSAVSPERVSQSVLRTVNVSGHVEYRRGAAQSTPNTPLHKALSKAKPYFLGIQPKNHTLKIEGTISYTWDASLHVEVTISDLWEILTFNHTGFGLFQVSLSALGEDPETPSIIFSSILLPHGTTTYILDIPLPISTSLVPNELEVVIHHLMQSQPCNPNTLADYSDPTAKEYDGCHKAACSSICPWDVRQVPDPSFRTNRDTGILQATISLSVPRRNSTIAMDPITTAYPQRARAAGADFGHARLEPTPARPAPAPVLAAADRPGAFSGLPPCRGAAARGHWYARAHVCAIDPPYCARQRAAVLLDGGYYWIPASCQRPVFGPAEALACLRRHSTTHFFGDSTLRTTYEHLLALLRLPAPGPYRANRTRLHGVAADAVGGARLAFRMNTGLSLRLAGLDVAAVLREDSQGVGGVLVLQPSRWEGFMPDHLFPATFRRLVADAAAGFQGRIVVVLPEPSANLGVASDLLWRQSALALLAEPEVRARVHRVVDVFEAAAPFRSAAGDGVHYEGLLARLKLNTVLDAVCSD